MAKVSPSPITVCLVGSEDGLDENRLRLKAGRSSMLNVKYIFCFGCQTTGGFAFGTLNWTAVR
jgi:hypothetical protein